ncbi:MAG: hypothetical protein V3R81_02585 [Gammaproteobacteria bacterium]
MALSTGGTDLVNNAAAVSNQSVAVVNFLWDGATPTDETTNLMSLSINRMMSAPRAGQAAMGRGVAATATVTLANPDGRYSPENSSSPLFSDIGTNKAMTTEVRIDLGYNDDIGGDEVLSRFTGRVDSPAIGGPRAPTVSFSLIGFTEARLLEHRSRIIMQNDQYADQVIGTLLDEANVPGGDQDLDTGFHRIPFYWIEAEDVFRQCQLIAEADAGFFYVKEDGDAVFENVYHWLTNADHSTSVITLDESMYMTASLGYEQVQLHNSVRVPYQPRRAGEGTVLFQLNQTLVIDPGETKTVNWRLKYPAVSIDTLIAGDHYIAIDAGGGDRSADIAVTVTAFAQSVDVQIVNSNATYAVEFREFRIEGSPLVGGPTDYVEKDASGSSIGDPTASGIVKRLEVGENPAIQTEAQADMLASIALDRSDDPRQTLTLAGVPAIPYLQLGDRVTVTVTEFGISSVDYFVTGITPEQYGPGPLYEMGLTLLEASSFYQFTAAQYFVLNTDAPSAGTSDRVFY